MRTDDKADDKKTADAVPEKAAYVALPPADHPAWDDLKGWVQEQVGAVMSEAAKAAETILPPLNHPAWGDIKEWLRHEIDAILSDATDAAAGDTGSVKGWVRREIELALEGHSPEQRAAELNP